MKGTELIVNGDKIKITAERDPSKLNWKGVDVVIESTGVFRDKESCMKHITAGAKKVILTVPPKGEIDAMVVLGVNENVLNRK